MFCKKKSVNKQNCIWWGNGGDFLSKTCLKFISDWKTNDPVAMHFYTNAHTVDDYSVLAIEKLHIDEIYRIFRENLWKKKLNIYMPYGNNKREQYSG